MIEGRVFTFFISIIICLLSFYFCSSIHPEYYNSDQAIHVLMAKTFSWPQDAYYWGQNRLGSLFPLLLYPLLKTQIAHPVYLASVLNYLMLFFAWFVFSRALEAKWKILFCIAVFLPHPTYYYNILIGHPYQAQFFSLAISYYFLPQLHNKFQRNIHWNWLDHIKLMVSGLGFLLAFWVSEMSAIFLIFIVIYLLLDSTSREQIKLNFRNRKGVFLAGFGLFFFGLIYTYYLKSLFMSDPVYNKLFISSWSDISLQFSYFFNQLQNAFLFRKHYSIIDGIFYYIVLICLLFLGYLLLKGKHPKQHLLISFFLSSFISCWLLFFSSWNLRSHFDAKYYGLLYTFLWIGIGLAFQSYSNKIQWLVFVLLLITNAASAFTMVQRNFRHETIFQQNKIEPDIPRGTILGSYWRVFKIASIYDQLDPAAKDLGDARNWLKREVWTSNENFYVFSDELHTFQKRGDTLIFMDMKLLAGTDSFSVGNHTLIRYKNLDTNKHRNSNWINNGLFSFIEGFYWKLRRFLFNY